MRSRYAQVLGVALVATAVAAVATAVVVARRPGRPARSAAPAASPAPNPSASPTGREPFFLGAFPSGPVPAATSGRGLHGRYHAAVSQQAARAVGWVLQEMSPPRATPRAADLYFADPASADARIVRGIAAVTGDAAFARYRDFGFAFVDFTYETEAPCADGPHCTTAFYAYHGFEQASPGFATSPMAEVQVWLRTVPGLDHAPAAREDWRVRRFAIVPLERWDLASPML